MDCEACGAALEAGHLVVSPPPPRWHASRDAFLVLQLAVKWPHFLARACSLVAWRCRACRTLIAGSRSDCTHMPEAGYLHVWAGLRWWAGEGDFQPTLWFPFSNRDRRGGACETLFSAWRSEQSARCPARRCRACGWLSFDLTDVGPSWWPAWFRTVRPTGFVDDGSEPGQH